MKGTPLPFGHELGGNSDSASDSELSDGSMTEVTVEAVSPLTEDDDEEEGEMGMEERPPDLSERRNSLMFHSV